MRGAAALAAVLLLASCDPPRSEQTIRPPEIVSGTFASTDASIAVFLGNDGEFQARLVRGTVDATAPVVYEVGDCHRITFQTGPPHNIHFTGCAGRNAMLGQFRFADGTEQRVNLKRR